MIWTVYCGVLAVLLTSCASTPVPAPPAPAGHQAGGEGAVLAAMDRYMHAISANDLQTMAAMQTPDGMTYRARGARAMNVSARHHTTRAGEVAIVRARGADRRGHTTMTPN